MHLDEMAVEENEVMEKVLSIDQGLKNIGCPDLPHQNCEHPLQDIQWLCGSHPRPQPQRTKMPKGSFLLCAGLLAILASSPTPIVLLLPGLAGLFQDSRLRLEL